MIAYLIGKIIVKRSNYIILQCQNIGYKIFIVPTQSYSDNNAELFIHEHITEDKNDLYGFIDIGQLEIFELLLSVSGLGPKIALTVLSSMSKNEIEGAIETGDVKAFQKLKGIGQKMAMKIILELKSKLDLVELENLKNGKRADIEVEEVLLSLGYKKKEISKIIDSIPTEIKDLESRIKWALKHA